MKNDVCENCHCFDSYLATVELKDSDIKLEVCEECIEELECKDAIKRVIRYSR